METRRLLCRIDRSKVGNSKKQSGPPLSSNQAAPLYSKWRFNFKKSEMEFHRGENRLRSSAPFDRVGVKKEKEDLGKHLSPDCSLEIVCLLLEARLEGAITRAKEGIG